MGRGATVSEEMRKIIVQFSKNGKSSSEIGKEMKVPSSTIRSILNKYKKTGNYRATRAPGRPAIINAYDIRALERIIKAKRHSSITDLQANWNQMTGKHITKETILIISA